MVPARSMNRQQSIWIAGYSYVLSACLFFNHVGVEEAAHFAAASAARSPAVPELHELSAASQMHLQMAGQETRCKLFDVHFNGLSSPPLTTDEISGERTGFYITGNVATFTPGTTILYQAGYRSAIDDERGTGGPIAASMSVWITAEGYLRIRVFCGGAPSNTANNVAAGNRRSREGGYANVETVATSIVAITDGQEHTFRVEQASSRVRLQVDFGKFSSGGKVECSGIHWDTLHIGGRRLVHGAHEESALRVNTRQPEASQAFVVAEAEAPYANYKGDLGSLRHRVFWIGKRSGTVDLRSIAQAQENASMYAVCANTTDVQPTAGAVSAGTQKRADASAKRETEETAGCTSGVIYGFMDNSAMPLQAAWQKYFDGCPVGSFKIVAHTHNQTSWQAAGSAPFMQTALRVKDPIPGNEMRFHFGMIKAMHLMMKIGDAEVLSSNDIVPAANSSANTANEERPERQQQCRPQWMHFLSDSCLPITSCKQVHHFLRRQPPHSFVDFRMSPPHKESTRLGRVRCKSSQWVTLHEKDLHLFASQLFDEAYWTNFAFAPDEYYFCTELRARQHRMRGRVMLYNEMPRPNPTGNAKWLGMSDIRRLTSKKCINEPFVRKFKGYTNVSSTQIAEVLARELPICITKDPSLDNRDFEIY